MYRKPTHTNAYSKFRSNRPARAHLNNIKGLIYRAYRLCSTAEDLQEGLALITNTFNANGYPPHKVDEVVKNYKPLKEKEKEAEEKKDERLDTLFIPYVKGISEKLERVLKKKESK